MDFHPLGYDTEDEVKKRLKPGRYIVIRDDDAANVGASDCWFAAQGRMVEVVSAYKADGGTVSSAYEWEI